MPDFLAPVVIVLFVLLALMLMITRINSYQRRKKKLMAQMEEITASHITAVALPKTLSDAPYAIKEGDKAKMEAGVEYAYFYGSRDVSKAQTRRYHSITIFSLQKLDKPVFKSMTDDEVISKLKEDGWQQSGSQSFDSDDVVAHYFQRSV